MLRAGRVLVLDRGDLRHPKAGGAETRGFEIMSRTPARGFEISLLASGFAGGAVEECAEGVDGRRLGGLARSYPLAVLACARETRRDRCDVVVGARETGFLVATCDIEGFTERIGARLRADAAVECGGS
jgi:hypothetical protein